MKNYHVFLLALMIVGSSCKKNTIMPKEEEISWIVTSENMEGMWVFKSTRPSFSGFLEVLPAERPATTNEKYQFSTNNLTYKSYIDDKLVEEGSFNLTMNGNKTNITFSKDETSATIFFKNESLVIGSRIPKGSQLIDYEYYRYYTRK